ncbi:MAG: hypothetical protein KGN80_00075 [Acidobacteriota bacterium]|nr:hypothetical protein [Acidobacteriota bacterium]
MILDKLGEFCDATSVAAAAGTALVGSQIDLGASSLDIGAGEPIYLVITTDTEIITAGVAGTLQFKLASYAQAAVATDGTATVHITTPSYVTGDAAVNSDQLNAGGVIYAGALPSGTYERYLGILAITGTTTTTAGKINAFLTKDVAKWKAYADAFA